MKRNIIKLRQKKLSKINFFEKNNLSGKKIKKYFGMLQENF